MKKMVVIGNAADVVEKKRGSFLNSYFDEIVIINKTIFNLETHKDYIGIPTIWSCCGWTGIAEPDKIFDPSEQDKKLVVDIIKHSSIKKVLLNHVIDHPDQALVLDSDGLTWLTPVDIKIESMTDYKLNNYPYHSTGLISILYGIAQGYDVYYFGFDSYRKSHHYYQEIMPSNVYTLLHSQSNYLRENMEIKKLVKEGKLTHINTIC